jgi:muramoyltetrapeptide carboxypeptidase LdcA involved in peptidoglycan recycling
MSQKLYARKLRSSAHVRVIAPSRSLSIISDSVRSVAVRRLEALGLHVSFGKHAMESDDYASSSVTARLEDLHDAFADQSVDAIFTAIGGYNAAQLLHGIDYELIKSNPKILCGFSDISILSNAIYAKTGLVGYNGLHFSSWGMEEGFEYSGEMAQHCLFDDKPYQLSASPAWSDDQWFIDQNARVFHENPGMHAVNLGAARGTIIGGHVRCLAALQGTHYRPSFENTILFLEEDEEINDSLFDRLLYSLCYQTDFAGVKGIVIGRFQTNSKISPTQIRDIVKANPLLAHLPVIIGADIGHTTPMATFPIGGECELTADEHIASVTITKH